MGERVTISDPTTFSELTRETNTMPVKTEKRIRVINQRDSLLMLHSHDLNSLFHGYKILCAYMHAMG